MCAASAASAVAADSTLHTGPVKHTLQEQQVRVIRLQPLQQQSAPVHPFEVLLITVCVVPAGISSAHDMACQGLAPAAVVSAGPVRARSRCGSSSDACSPRVLVCQYIVCHDANGLLSAGLHHSPKVARHGTNRQGRRALNLDHSCC